MEEILARPSLNEDDDDLLSMQENFLKEHQDSGVKIIKVESKDRKKCDVQKSSKEPANGGPVKTAFVMNDIVEKDVSAIPITFPIASKSGFPSATKLSKSSFHEKNKTSYLMQQRKKNTRIEEPTSSYSNTTGETSALGSDEYVKVSEENEMKLKNMTLEDISSQQKELLSTLDPKTIAYLKSKRSNKTTNKSPPNADKGDSLKRKIASEKQVSEVIVSNSVATSIGRGKKCVKFDVETKSTAVNNPSRRAAERLKVCKIKNKVEKTLDELNVPVNKYPHMDEIEAEKLQWMTDVQDTNESKNTARFNFQGFLILDDADVDSKEGLHHHSEEPNRAGYSVDEVFMMTRSTTISQRVLGLQMLGKILQNNDQGIFHNVFNGNLVDHLLGAGIVPLLRFALDDSTETTISAAIFSTKHLLYSQFDEICIDSTFNWQDGHRCPFLSRSYSLSEKDLEERSDDEVIKNDVIRGLLRMDLMQRLVYVFKLISSDYSVTTNIIQILIRISRHSYNAAYKIVKNPELVKLLVNKFSELIGSISTGNADQVEVLLNCLKLFRSLTCVSKDIAKLLVFQYNIMELVTPILGNDCTSFTFSKECTNLLLQLHLESFRFWRVLLTYGLSLNTYLDLYSILMKHVHKFPLISFDAHTVSYDSILAATLMSVLEGILHHALDQNPEDTSRTICYSQVYGLLSPLLTCVKKWTWHIARNLTPVSNEGLIMVGKSLDLVNMFYMYLHRQNANDATIHDLNSYFQDALLLFIKSDTYNLLLARLTDHSSFSSESCKSVDPPPNLASLGHVFGRVDTSPILKPNCPYPFMTSLISLINTLKISNQTLSLFDQLAGNVLNHKSLKNYLRKILKARPKVFHWCKRYELRWIYYISKLGVSVTHLADEFDFELLYDVAVCVVSHFQNGDEKIALDLVEGVIFNELSLQSHLKNFKDLDQDDVIVDAILQNIENMKTTFINSMFALIPPISENLGFASITVFDPTETIFPTDWLYLPLVSVFTKISSNGKKSVDDSQVTSILNCLLWVLFLKFKEINIVQNLSFATHYCRLSCIFLAGNDVFMQPKIHDALERLIEHFFKSSNNRLEFDQPIPGISSFPSYFEELIIQYEAVSYGDKLFGSFLMIPLQQTCSTKLKITLWNQHSSALRILSSSKFVPFLPLDNYLAPYETDHKILRCYFSSLISGTISESSDSVLYLIAVRHLHNFIHSSDHEYSNLSKQLKSAIIEYIESNQSSDVVSSLQLNASNVEKISSQLEKTTIT